MIIQTIFVVAPELARFKIESKQIDNVDQKRSSNNHESSNAARSKLFLSALSFTMTLQGLYEGGNMINIATEALVSEDVQKHLAPIKQNGIGIK